MPIVRGYVVAGRNLLERRLRSTVGSILDRLDLTQLIVDHVSFSRILDAIDVDELLAHVNLAGITEHIMDEVDLPDIVRGSSGALASEGVASLRAQSAAADAAVDRVVSRLIPGRRVATRGGR